MASLSRRAFEKYPNKYLIESGTYLGDGIKDALDNKFSQVISFEIQLALCKAAKERFKDHKNVEIICGSSASMLYDHIKDIKEPITFWLDGHYSAGVTGFDADYVNPLIQELTQIAKHPVKSHTILIDDRRLLIKNGKGGMDTLFDMTEDEVVKAIMAINPKYKIKYEDGHVKDDIIVAYL